VNHALHVRYVHSFNYRGLQKFANSFDYSSQKWIDFYKHRDAKHAEAQAAAEEAARMAQEEAAQARVLIEASPGFVLVEHPDDKDAQLRTIAKEMAQAQRVLALVLGDTAQQKLDNVLELDAQQFLAASAAAAAQPMFPARLHATETPSSRSRGGRGASSNGADASQSQKSKKKKAVQKKRVRLRDRLFKQLRGGDSDVDGEPELGPGLSIFLGDGPAGTADKIRLPRVVRERLSRSLPSTTKEPSAPDLGPGLSVFLGEAPVKTPRTPPTLTAGATCNQARAAADGAGAGAGGAKLQAADAATNVGSQPPVEVVSEPSPVVDTGTSSTVASSEGAVAVGGTAGGGGAVTSPAPEVASTTTTTTEALPAAPAKPDVASPVTEHESSSTTAVSPAAASPMLLRVSRALQETCNAADQGGDVFHGSCTRRMFRACCCDRAWMLADLAWSCHVVCLLLCCSCVAQTSCTREPACIVCCGARAQCGRTDNNAMPHMLREEATTPRRAVRHAPHVPRSRCALPTLWPSRSRRWRRSCLLCMSRCAKRWMLGVIAVGDGNGNGKRSKVCVVVVVGAANHVVCPECEPMCVRVCVRPMLSCVLVSLGW